MPLNVLVVMPDYEANREHVRASVDAVLRKVLDPRDRVELGDVGAIRGADRWDLVIVWSPVGWHPAAAAVAEACIPCFALGPAMVFHPYFARFLRDVEECGGALLPADTPDEIAASLEAVRARKALAATRLLVVDANDGNERAGQIARFTECCRRRLGVEIEHHSVAELRSLAAELADDIVEAEWQRWLAELLVDEGEMSAGHMTQVVRLYLAERRMLADTYADGITVDDIGAFLLAPERSVMPNATYAPLTADGYLACEEGDIEALVTEAILRTGLGAHPSMSNIYMAYRDAMDRLQAGEPYTSDLERLDYLQCLSDNHVVAAHFSAAGVLPPNMMQQDRYRVREALPSWPGQSMTSSTPKLGPVVLARLAGDASRIHMLPGEVDDTRADDRHGWYRGRWMIRIPSARRFVANCLHQHYAIAPENGRSVVLDTLTGCILRLGRLDRTTG